MRCILLVALLLGSPWARAAAVPELRRQLAAQPTDSGRVRLLNELCHALHDNQPTEALRYGEQAVTLARKLPDRPGLLPALLSLASCYANLADGPHALALQQEALLLARHQGSNDGLVRSFTGMGSVYHERNDTAAALRNYRQALRYAYEPTVRASSQRVLFGNLGNLYFGMRYRALGMQFTRRALALARSNGDRAGESLYLANLGTHYLQMDRLETAEGLLRKAVALLEPLPGQRFEPGHLELLATVLLRRDELDEAEQLTRQALALARRLDYQERALDAYSLLASITAARGQYDQAYEWQLRFRDLNDSLNSRSRLQTLLALQTRYETADKERLIRQLTDRETVMQQRNRALLGTIVTLLLGLGGAGLLYTKLRRSRAALTVNIQALEQTSAELRQVAASKDRLYAIVAHDLRGPITSFASVTELIDFYLRQGDDAGLRRLPELVRQSAQQLNHLLDNLLNWAVSHTGELAFRPQVLSVAELFEDTRRLYASALEAAQITLHIATEPGLVVWADSHMTETILRNLIGNALKFTYPGGQIRLVAVAGARSQVELRVEDTGCGMPPAQLAALRAADALALPLPSLHSPRSGTGLGLLLCRAFILRQAGTLRIESLPGQGTTMLITLPVASEISESVRVENVIPIRARNRG